MFMNASSNPYGMSNESYPDGTPKSNWEAFRDRYDENYARRNDYH